MADVDGALNYLLSCRPSAYYWWLSGEVSRYDGPPAWAVNEPAPPPHIVQEQGGFCAAAASIVLRWLGLPIPNPYNNEAYDGGTVAYYAAYYDVSQWFNWAADYPDGTLLISPFVEGVSQGHVSVVKNYNGTPYCIEWIVNGGLVWDYTVPESNAWGAYEIAVPPEVWLGSLETPEVPTEEPPEPFSYPGDTAAPEAVAAWMARVAEQDYGLPGILPVMCSCVELTQAWTGPGDVKDVPGYLYNVDYDSLGYFQQRPSQGWGTPRQVTDATYALNKFCEVASQYIGWFGDTPEDLGAWCQKVQISAEPEKYAMKGYPMAVALLKDAPPPEKPPEKEAELAWSKYTFAAIGQPYASFANAAVAALEEAGVDAGAHNGEKNIVALARDANSRNDVSALNCVVVGKAAYDALEVAEKTRYGWTSDTPIWAVSGDTEAMVLKKVRDWALGWIAEYGEGLEGGKVALVQRFEDVLLAMNHGRYAPLLALVDTPEMPEPPDPPKPPMTLEETVADHEERITALEGSK